ncbi:MAG: hypothetical protein ACI4VF_05810 [Lachnospirales bacterium]
MKSLKISALYVCAILGAGFATGKELLEYFGKFGLWGILGVLISSIIFSMVAFKAVKINKFTNSKIVNIISIVFLIVLYSAMLSATGEIFKTVFNMPFIYGCGIMAIIGLIAISDFGKSIGEISLILFPVIILICIITGIYILTKSNMVFTKYSFSPKIIISAILYSAYNIITAVSLLTYEDSKSNSISIALISGISIFVLAIVLVLPIILNFDTIKNEPLPLLCLLPKGSVIFYLYIFMLVSAIFTTAVTNGLSAVRQSGFSPFIITLIAFLLSFLGFSTIVSKVYFIFGIFGGFILIKLFFKKERD